MTIEIKFCVRCEKLVPTYREEDTIRGVTRQVCMTCGAVLDEREVS